MDLRAIKRKIAAGEITRIGDLQISLLILSYNALMINRSDTIVFSDASNFQSDLVEDCQVFKFFCLMFAFNMYIYFVCRCFKMLLMNIILAIVKMKMT